MKICLLKLSMTSISPLSLFDGDDVLIDGKKAYLSGTSIAGGLRSYLESMGKETENLFGGHTSKDKKQSKIYFYDSYADVKEIERRVEIGVDDRLGSTIDGSKREEEYYSRGLEFELTIKIDDYEEGDMKLLIESLKALDRGIIRLGGNKSNGLGKFRIDRLERDIYDLSNIDDLTRYLRRDFQAEDIKEDLLGDLLDEGYCSFRLEGGLTSPLLISGVQSYDVDSVDYESIRSGGEYIVPGSSFKGVLKSRMKQIENYLGEKKLVNEVFGSSKDGKSNEISKIFVDENIIYNTRERVDHSRIKIDKFTGGTLTGSLHDDRPVKGDIDFNLIYKTQNNEDDNYIIKLILLALRDLAMEDLVIGSGTSIGRGRYKGKKLTINYANETIEVDFSNKKIENKELLDRIILS